MGLMQDIAAPDVQVQRRRLLRRLTVECPVTGRPSDTGFGVTDLPSITPSVHWLLDCLECGQDHLWRADDLRLE